MVDANATRLCVVCGAVFVRQHKRVYCSDACANTRQRQQSRASHVRLGLIKGDQTHKCKHCSVEFVGCANKVYCTQRCKDRARPAPKQPRKRSRNDAQRARDNEVKRLRRKTEDRSAEFERTNKKRRDETAQRVRTVGHSYPSDGVLARRKEKAYQTAHALAIRMNEKRDARIAKRLAAAKEKERRATDKALGLPSPELEKLRSNLVKYAEYLTKSRAKGFKKKTGRIMPDDGTVDAVVMFGSPRCLYCDCRLSWANRTHDHMTPLIKRGVHSARNIAPACKDCNDKKGPKEFYVWVQSLDDEHKQRAIKFFEERNGTIEFQERLAA